MAKHVPLAVDARHFDRWLALFEQTAREVCPPAAAERFIERARRVAESLELGVASARTAFCSARANATAAKRDLCARARLLVGEQREQDFSLVPDDAHKRLRLRCFCPLYIGVTDDDGFDGNIFNRRIGLDDLGAIQIDQDVLHLRELLLKREQTACLARVRFGSSVSAKAGPTVSEIRNVSANVCRLI